MTNSSLKDLLTSKRNMACDLLGIKTLKVPKKEKEWAKMLADLGLDKLDDKAISATISGKRRFCSLAYQGVVDHRNDCRS